MDSHHLLTGTQDKTFPHQRPPMTSWLCWWSCGWMLHWSIKPSSLSASSPRTVPHAFTGHLATLPSSNSPFLLRLYLRQERQKRPDPCWVGIARGQQPTNASPGLPHPAEPEEIKSAFCCQRGYFSIRASRGVCYSADILAGTLWR